MIVIIIIIRKKGEKEPKIIKYPMSHPLKEFKYSM